MVAPDELVLRQAAAAEIALRCRILDSSIFLVFDPSRVGRETMVVSGVVVLADAVVLKPFTFGLFRLVLEEIISFLSCLSLLDKVAICECRASL